MSDVAYCKNIKCVLYQKRAQYPNEQVPACRLCGVGQEIERRVPDPVVRRPALPTWEVTAFGGAKPEVLQVAMYAPCTNPGKTWGTASAIAEIAALYDDVAADDRDGVAPRLRLLGDKVLAANDLLTATERRVQKVFVVPEWFFRKCFDEGYYGGQYSEDEMKQAVEGLLTLSARAGLSDWLIVAGSIRWRRPVTTATRSYSNGTSVGAPMIVDLFTCKNAWLELNTTVVVCNGKMVHCYYKKWNGGDTGSADTETVDPEQLGTSAIKRIFAAQASVRRPLERIRTALNQLVSVAWHFGVDIDDAVVAGSFTFKALKMGVEICADADMEALRDDANQTLDLHVVVSCDLEDLAKDAERCAAIKTKGYLVQCDGNQLKAEDHPTKSFKVVRRNGVSYSAVKGTLHGKTVPGAIYVVDLALD